MIKFFNGHELTFACGSGALAFDGKGWWWERPLRWFGYLDPKAFTVVAKTVTLNPVKGNLSMWHPWTCVRILHDNLGRKGAVNAIGLTNRGLKHLVDNYYPVAKKKGYAYAVSVKPDTPDEARQMVPLLHRMELAYVEINVSCPNVHDVPQEVPEILKILKNCWHPIVLKLSKSQVAKTFIDAVDEYVDAYHGINTEPWDKVFPNKKSPLEDHLNGQKGGVSGDYIHVDAVSAVRHLKRMSQRPVIGGGGIFEMSHVRSFESNGADAFSIGTCFLLHPTRPNKIVKEYMVNKRETLRVGI